ncbi:hypothetical protein M0805_001218 [Coniferiporia weirii]|nr:hypothetical protein M0805_001218 [Coniferiporia weirii]
MQTAAIAPRAPYAKKKRYQQPDGAVAAFLWRTYMWLATTLGLSVMEPWELVFVLTVLGALLALLVFGFVRLFPQFILTSLSRARYYLLGSDAVGHDFAVDQIGPAAGPSSRAPTVLTYSSTPIINTANPPAPPSTSTTMSTNTNTDTITQTSEPGRNPVKLALLLCDTPIPAVRAVHGTYLDIFRAQLRGSYPRRASGAEAEAEAEAAFPFSLDGFDVVEAQEYPDLDEGQGYAGVLISGSAASAYEDKPWIDKLVAWTAHTAQTRPDVKLIGICFGHQIIARALGGACVPNGGQWEIGSYDLDLTDVGRAVFGTEASTIAIQQMHRDHVPALPPSFLLLCSTPITPVHGMVRLYPPSTGLSPSPPSSPTPPPSSAAPTTSPSPPIPPPPPPINPSQIHILTVQGHPEFTPDIVHAIVDARSRPGGPMDAAVAREGRERAERPHEGIGAVGRAIWRVLGVQAPPA